MKPKHRGKLPGAMGMGALAMFLSCTTSVCDCLPILSTGAVAGDVLTSQQQPAAGARVSFLAAMTSSCDPNQFREPLFVGPGDSLSLTADQSGHFSILLVTPNGGSRCVWVIARLGPGATDSSVATLVTDFSFQAPADTADIILTLP
jgi:hypothetical protein